MYNIGRVCEECRNAGGVSRRLREHHGGAHPGAAQGSKRLAARRRSKPSQETSQKQITSRKQYKISYYII